MLDSIQPRNHAAYRPVPQPPRKPKYSRFRIYLAAVMLLLLSGGIFVGSKLVILAGKILEGDGGFSLRGLFIASDRGLSGEEEKEIRILLLGIGGEKHDGGTLTDTMILATVKLPENKDETVRVGLVSIPRDLWAQMPSGEYRKINAAFALGESGDKNEGPQYAIQAVEKLLNVSIPYYTVIDFAGFQKIIDDLEGIKINVERTFTDAQYPDNQGGYLPAITFSAGSQEMDGDTALQYVRSRHGNNGEGSDFARSRRQQQVLSAIRDKILSLKTITNVNLIGRILNDFSDHLRTNMAPYEIKRLYDLTRKLEREHISSTAIDTESGLVCNSADAATGAYILLPCQGITNYTALRELVKNQFVIAGLQKEEARIEIQATSGADNATRAVTQKLAFPGAAVTTSAYRGGAAYQESVIYDNTGGRKPETLNHLKDTLGMKVAGGPFPFSTSTKVDFVIVVAN